MRALVSSFVVLLLAGPAATQSRYDRKLEEAALSIVAARIGDLRGSFDFGVKPVMVIVRDDAVMGTTDPKAAVDPMPEGMSRAVERRPG